MKKLWIAGCIAVGMLPFMSATLPTHAPMLVTQQVQQTIYFKVQNNTNQVFSYYVNGNREDIQPNENKGFAFPDGQEIYHWDNGRGDLWFKITPDMNGKSYTLTQLLSGE